VDIAGAEMLAQEARRRRKMGGGLYFYRMKESVRAMLEKGGYLEEIGEENLFPARSDPMDSIYARLDKEICRNCDKRIFMVCRGATPQAQMAARELKRAAG
jgi:SulP family sulfate permease